jgi:hypothetical protein
MRGTTDMAVCLHGHTDPQVVFVVSPHGRRRAITRCGVCGARI